MGKSSCPQTVKSMEAACTKPCKPCELFLNISRKRLDFSHVAAAHEVMKNSKTVIHGTKFEVSKHQAQDLRA